MMKLITFLIVFQLNSNLVLSQRVFANPAVTDPAPCACDLRANLCDANCCCDPDCTDSDLTVSPICNSVRSVYSYSSSAEQNLQTWNCSNTTSAARYDYFPFVCIRFTLNEIIGEYYPTKDGVTFLTSYSDATSLLSSFVTQYPELFQPITLSSSSTKYNSIGAPVLLTSGARFTLPGNLAGINCQTNVPVLFGINSDVTCTSGTLSGFCATVAATTSVLKDGQTNTNVNFQIFTKNYTATTSPTRDSVTEYYFKDSFVNVSQIASTTGSISDYCLGRHPLYRTQRYFSCSGNNAGLCPNQYQTYTGCTLRDSLQYSTIPESFFTGVTTSIDGPTNFADFDGSTSAASIPCSANDIQRVFYRFNYSSIDNTISTVELFVLLTTLGATVSPRITIEWNDIANNSASSTSIPRGYLNGEVLQFRRNSIPSDVSNLVPSSNGLCIDATRQTLRYKQDTSSFCFIQLQQQTIKQCHDLKLNMYLYLNAFYAPASDVLSYPSATASLVKIRDTNQDLSDLDRIDETRPNNRLNQSYISQTSLGSTTYSIYDTSQILPVCYNVPSGVYIEFGFVRLYVSPTVYYERIVSVQYNYTYSNWESDCTQANCTGTATGRYLVSFQTAFVDYTNLAFYSTGVTRADITSADNYIDHLLWLITPEYNGEPGYRNYTIAMILIFIAISAVVMHVLLFGLMCPF